MTKPTLTKSQKRIKSKVLTQERLKQELYYDQRSGRFKRVLTDMPPENGHLVPNNNRGRLRISVFGKLYEASRLAVLWMEGYLPEKPLEHRNGRLFDYRWKNLTVDLPYNKSGVPGVSWSKKHKCWHAYMIIKKHEDHDTYSIFRDVRKNLGWYKNLEDAIQARIDAGAEYLCDGVNESSIQGAL